MTKNSFVAEETFKNYAISTGKTLSWIESLFNKVAGLQECNFITFKNTYFEE